MYIVGTSYINHFRVLHKIRCRMKGAGKGGQRSLRTTPRFKNLPTCGRGSQKLRKNMQTSFVDGSKVMNIEFIGMFPIEFTEPFNDKIKCAEWSSLVIYRPLYKFYKWLTLKITDRYLCFLLIIQNYIQTTDV